MFKTTTAALMALALTACGVGGADYCGAVDQLTALETRVTDDYMQALEDVDSDQMSAILNEVADEAKVIRDQFSDDQTEVGLALGASASGFIAGANLLDRAFNSGSHLINPDDIDSAMSDMRDARESLSDARELTAEECG